MSIKLEIHQIDTGVCIECTRAFDNNRRNAHKNKKFCDSGCRNKWHQREWSKRQK